jgi:hypothetical protein
MKGKANLHELYAQSLLHISCHRTTTNIFLLAYEEGCVTAIEGPRNESGKAFFIIHSNSLFSIIQLFYVLLSYTNHK